MKLCIACSGGGHLTEITQLEKAYGKHEHFFVTFRREDTQDMKEGRVHFVTDPKRNPLKLIKNTVQSFRILLRERPDVVITTGAGVVIPICYMAKLFRKKVVYIESFCRVKDPSLTGRLLYPVADLFLVQWEETLQAYGKKAVYGGPVF